jgi:hypothetical protein
MHPLLVVALRWFVAGIAANVGWEVGKAIVGNVDKDNWIVKGISETKEDLKKTWSGRYTDSPEETNPQCDKPNCCGH